MKQTSKLKMRRARFIFIMVLPAILFPMIFTYYPMIKGSLMAFQSYNLMNVKNIKWVGLDNFSKLFAHNTSNTFYSTMLNTVKWVGISLFVQFTVGFAMALLLKKKFKGSGLYQGLIFFPWAVSGFIIGIMWRWMFNGTSGVINDLLIRIHLIGQPVGWLASKNTALYSCIIANIWYGIPFFTIMITAALRGVSEDLYEAGAGFGHFQKLLADFPVEKLHETIRDFHKAGSGTDIRELEQKRQKVRDKISEKNDRLSVSGSLKAPEKKTIDPKKLKKGDLVKIVSMGLKGTVSTLPDAKGSLFVQCGIIRTQANINDLILTQENDVTGPANLKLGRTGAGKMKMSKSLSISTEINLLGMTTDEALAQLDKYLDDAYLAHLPSVRIVHGKGTGALRSAVQRYLRQVNYVESFRLGEHGEGDAGVTIATFKK